MKPLKVSNASEGLETVLSGYQLVHRDDEAPYAYTCSGAGEEIAQAVNYHEVLLDAVRKAEQLASIASDWNLDEVEIDGKMIPTYDLQREFASIIRKVSAQ